MLAPRPLRDAGARWAALLPDAPALLALALVAVTALALIALPPSLGAALVAGAVVTAIVVIRPVLAFYLLLLSIPAQDVGARGELTLTNLLFALTVAAWIVRRTGAPRERAGDRARQTGRWGAIGPAFALFVGALALSLIVVRELMPGIAALFQWAKALIAYGLALDLLRTRRRAVGALVALLIAGTGEALLGLVQYLTGVGPASFAIGEQFSRAFGTFGRPNSYAGYLEMIFPLGLLLTAWLGGATRSTGPATSPEGSRWRRRLILAGAGGATATIGAAILASYSRGAWLGTLGAIATIVLLAGPRSRGIALGGALAIVPLALSGGTSRLPADIRDRLGSILGGDGTADVRTAFVTAENFAILERRSHWEAGLRMFAEHRALGVGLGNYNLHYTEFNVSPTFMLSQGHAHNYYIHVAAESGLIGLGAYLVLLAAIILTGLRALWVLRAGRDPFARAVVIAGLAVVVAVAIHNIFENLHVLSLGIQLSTVWALITNARRGFASDRCAGEPVTGTGR